MRPQEIIERASYLKRMHDDALIDRARFRAILNGGEDGIRQLLGPGLDNNEASKKQTALTSMLSLGEAPSGVSG